MKSSRTCRGEILKAKAEAENKSSRTRTRTKFWSRGQLVLEDLTSLLLLHGEFVFIQNVLITFLFFKHFVINFYQNFESRKLVFECQLI